MASLIQKKVEVGKLLECPVCFNVPDNQWFNCEKGHSVCDRCAEKLKKCMLCESRLTRARNYMIESLSEAFRKQTLSLETEPNKPLYCAYRKEGCEAEFPVQEKSKSFKRHIEVCDYRKVKCCTVTKEGNACFTMTEISAMFKHLVVHHGIKGKCFPSGRCDKLDFVFKGMEIRTSWRPYYFDFDDKIFIRNACIKDRNVYFWVQLIGPDSEANQYSACILLRKSSKDTAVAVKSFVRVMPFRLSTEEILRTDGAHCCVSTRAMKEKVCQFNVFCEDRGEIATHSWLFTVRLKKDDNSSASENIF